MNTEDIFEFSANRDTNLQPLPERLRPRKIQDMLGQDHLLGPGKVLRKAIEADRIPSMILWGPPGSGKTTLANVIAEHTGAVFVSFSAVLGGVKEIRVIVEEAKRKLAEQRRRTILFVDEIHRFNKGQQDALLPHVEKGTVIFIGATTENPSFEVNSALLSRCRVFTLKSLGEIDLKEVIKRGVAATGIMVEDDAVKLLVEQADGDARRALSALELASDVAKAGNAEIIDEALVAEAITKNLRHDRGDSHYDVTSAFIKSLRGSDPDAALYWMIRMLDAGEAPRFILRRMIIFAAEDIGNADPRALTVAINAAQAFEWTGLPEGAIPISMAVTYLASAPKSNASYLAMGRAREDVHAHGSLPVPMHLRNAPTKLLSSIGAGKGYKYPHDHPEGFAVQDYLPDKLIGRSYYKPTKHGFEKTVSERLKWQKQVKENARNKERQSESDLKSHDKKE